MIVISIFLADNHNTEYLNIIILQETINLNLNKLNFNINNEKHNIEKSIYQDYLDTRILNLIKII